MKAALLLTFMLVAFCGTLSMENEKIQDLMENLTDVLYEKMLDKICDRFTEKVLGKEEKNEISCEATRASSLSLGKEEKIENSCDLNPLCTISFNEKKFDFFDTEPDEVCKMDELMKKMEKSISNRINGTLLGKKTRFADSFIESKFDGFETDPDRIQSEPEMKMGKYIFKRPKFFFKLNDLFLESKNDLCTGKKFEDWETETEKLNLSISISQSGIELGDTDKPLREEEFMVDWMYNSPRADSDSDSDWVRFTEKKSDFFEIETDDEITFKVKTCISKPPKYPYKMDDLKKKMEKNWNVKLHKVNKSI